LSALAFFVGGIGMQMVATNTTMNSREIAELTGKQHSHVMRDIRDMLADIVKDDPDVDHIDSKELFELAGVRADRDGRGYVSCAWLDKDLTLTLLTGYSTKARLAVVKRWQELENQQPAIPQTLPEALRLAADLAEQVQAQQQQIEQQRPAVEFVGRYVDATGTMTFRQVAKTLGIKEPELRCILQDKKIMYRLNGAWVPYQPHVDAGRFVVKTGSADNGHAFTQARFTAKGVEWLAGVLQA
jgi:phage antirepressor YoqD-like protein